ncbi:MAG: PAS domain S-box protein [Thermodesulfobacteriota bacterium]
MTDTLMSRKPTYEELQNRVAALEAQNRRLAGAQGELGQSEFCDTHLEQQTLFSMSLDMICIADIHTASFLKVNPAFTTTLGYSEAELLSVPFTDFIHPEDLEPTRQAVTESLRKGKKVINFKNRYRCKNGEYRWLNWVSHPAPEKGVTYAVAHDITHEIEAFETLRSQRDLLNSLFDNLPMGITIWGDDGRLRMINEGFTALTGYTRAEIENLEDWFGRAYPDRDYRRLVMENWQRAAAASAGGAREFKVTCGDGKVKDIEFYGTFLKDGRALVTMADITDRRQAREEIRQRRQFLESVLYHAPDAIITLDERHRVVDWNPGAVKMFGYTPEEAIGAPLDDLVAKHEQFEEASSKTAQVMDGRRLEAFETIRYRKDGAPIHVIAAGSPIMIEGVLKGVVAVYTDITDRVHSEEALRISHQRFITVLNSMDALIYVADMKTHEILLTNRHMIEIYGRDLTGKICWEVFRKGSGPCPECSNDRLVDSEGKPTGVVVWQGHNPVYGRWYINYDRAIEWIDGRIVRLQIALDITDYKKMEDALRRAQKMEAVGTLAGGIAHDFNNLLMGIQGRTSLIAVDLDPAHPHAEHTAAIQEYIQSAANLTKQLLGFVRGGKYEVKPFDIHALVESSAAMFGRTRKEIRIRTRPSSEPLVVEADKRQIEQVLLNIYINAWQAMPEGGELSLQTEKVDLDPETCKGHEIPPGRYVKISLTDTGIGMTEAVRQKVFDPFFTTKDKGRGTGLGLASAYGIIKNHGGMMTVYSEVGHGSTFCIYLPISQREALPEMPTREEPVGGKETILLVDDEAMILEVGEAMLERLGYRVVTANSGAAAVACVSEKGGGIDLVILDLIMPGMDGGETFDRIRRVRPTLPVILSSGYSINGQAAAIMERGCNGFIQKPFTISALALKVREVMNKQGDSRKR